MTKGLTVREAITIAMEGLPGTIDSWVLSDDYKTLRAHLNNFVKDYAFKRGVILEEETDIAPEIEAIIMQLRGVAVARTKTPK